MKEAKVKKYSMAMEGQFHYGVFYAYMRLKEQEINNIGYLAELVSMNVSKSLNDWKKYVVPFSGIY